ncbi:effector-associated constant component EACC1 [Streptomyces melanosporofaciens]|uniref:effector-associated constant component EACC1 n=1 Tax=unclassified Streptomyces TaxID=2593676 RepID=UPI0036C7B0C9
MKVVITVRGDRPGDAGADDLRGWLEKQPALRGRLRRAADPAPQAGTMGLAADAVLALLAPGGVATVLAGALIAWVQTRKGSRTVTITRPDGTEISVTSTQVGALDARQTADLAQRIAAGLGVTERDDALPEPSPGSPGGPGPTAGPPAP